MPFICIYNWLALFIGELSCFFVCSIWILIRIFMSIPWYLYRIYILHTYTYRNLYASHFRSAYFIYHFASLLDLLHWNWMQLLHCEYELINSYNCPVIVFFVCRLFFSFSRATYMANLVFARVYARSRYPKLPEYYLFAFSRLKLRYLFNLNCIRSYAKNGHSYLIMFANFRKLYCLLLFFFQPVFYAFFCSVWACGNAYVCLFCAVLQFE